MTIEKLEQFTCHQLFKHLQKIEELERRLAEVEGSDKDEDGIERYSFESFFKESKDGGYVLLKDIVVEGNLFKAGKIIAHGDKLGRMKVCYYSYMDLACMMNDCGNLELKGFYSKDEN